MSEDVSKRVWGQVGQRVKELAGMRVEWYAWGRLVVPFRGPIGEQVGEQVGSQVGSPIARQRDELFNQVKS